MGGILKNKVEQDQQVPKLAESTKEFRNQVLENTKLNALLKDNNINQNILNQSGEIDPEKISQLSQDEKEKLKWNAENLQSNSIIQKQIIENIGQDTIDEPKTPFQAATDPELNEYYQDDDEIEDLDNFQLGEPEIKVDELDKQRGGSITGEPQETNNQEEEENDVDDDDDDESSKPKKSFDELRKQHYHHEHIPAFTKDVDEESEEAQADKMGNDEDDEETKPKKSFAEMRKQHYQNEHKPVVKNDEDEDDE